MPLILDYLAQKLLKVVHESGVVVWFDPERDYADSLDAVSESLQSHNCDFAALGDSYFALRHQVEPKIRGTAANGGPDTSHAPRLVVWVPRTFDEAQEPLCEIISAGQVVGSRQQIAPRNTRLALVARDALKATGQWTDEDASGIERQIENGGLKTVAEIEGLCARRGEATGILQHIFGPGSPDELALKFLSDEGYDAAITERGALPELVALLASTFGSPQAGATSGEFRATLARFITMSDLAGETGVLPSRLSNVQWAQSPVERRACAGLARAWRGHRETRQSYARAVSGVERELKLRASDFEFALDCECETLPCLETALLRGAQRALLQGADVELCKLCQTRQSGFWAEFDPGIQAHWSLLEAATTLLLEATRVEAELKSAPCDVVVTFELYTQGEGAWCALDGAHRVLERRFLPFEGPQSPEVFPPDEGQAAAEETLGQLMALGRRRYMEVGESVANCWLDAWRASDFEAPGLLWAREVWEKRLAPLLNGRGKGTARKVAYFWVDALRYEMARELANALEGDMECELTAAIASVPSITEIGMACLLPGAQSGTLFDKAGKVGWQIGETQIKDRAGRVAFLKAQCGVPFCAANLGELFPPDKKLRDEIKKARLILVTSPEIDAVCENGNIRQARREMESALGDLRSAFHKLAELGVDKIIVAADHGFLFGQEISSEARLEAPGGETRLLKRRVWLGKGGTLDVAALRAPLQSFLPAGQTSELELVTPRGFSVFKTQGALSYFHGGLSPQEVIVPVMRVTPRRVETRIAEGIEWQLELSRPRITTRFVSAIVGASVVGLFSDSAPKVRLELHDPEKDEVVSSPVSASYGLQEATSDLTLRPSAADPAQFESNTVTLLLHETSATMLSLRLLDAATGAILREVGEIEVTVLAM